MTQRLLIAAACLLATSLSGCATVRSTPDKEQASEPEWLENLKSLGSVGGTGVSREARAIEKSLGGG